MNVERLHVVARALRSEIEKLNIVNSLQNLANACQQLSQNPVNAGVQNNFANVRGNFLNTVTDTPSDSFPPAWRQILAEMGGEEFFGRRIKERVDDILSENQATLAVAQQELAKVLQGLQRFSQSLVQLTDAFAQFHIGWEQLAPGEAEVAVLIPRGAIHSKLAGYIGELDEAKFILETFSELATGRVEELDVRGVSSSDLMLYVAAAPYLGSVVAKAVDFVVTQYKKILEIRKLQREMERLGAPDDVSRGVREWANGQMEEGIEKFSLEIVAEHQAVQDGGRRNELTTKVKTALRRVANRVDRGFSFEVRIEPPSAPEEASKEDVQRAVQTIRSVSANLQYMKLEGPTILSLPESADEPGDGGEDKDARKKGHADRTKGRMRGDAP